MEGNALDVLLCQSSREMKVNPSTEWYRKNKNRPEVREQYNARQRKWYKENIEHARAMAREQQKRYRQANPKKAAESTERCRLWRGKRNQRFIDAYKSFFGCRKCGEGDPIVLDLHHRIPGEKDFTVSGVRFIASLLTLARELEKCDALCANCHRREHWKIGGQNGRSASTGRTTGAG